MCNNVKGGKVISFNRDSKTIPNLLSLMGGNLSEKLVGLPRVFEVLLEGLTDIQKPLLEHCILLTYKKKGITESNKSSWKNKAPVLIDLVKVMNSEKNKTSDRTLKNAYEIMVSKLQRFTEGVFKFIGEGSKDIDPKSDFIVFEFKTMPDEVRPVLMLVLLEFIKAKFLQDGSKKMLVLDEAWRMLKSSAEAKYVESFARTFRKHNGGILLITQSVAELKGSPEGKAFLANTAFRYILKTEKIVLDETCELFGLNNREKEIIMTAKQGEGILVWENKHYKVNVAVDPTTHDLITTNPEEQKKSAVKKVSKIKID